MYQKKGIAIKCQTQLPSSIINVVGIAPNTSNSEKLSLIQAANNLLNSVTKVLLLADVVIINQILNAKNKVIIFLKKTFYKIFIKILNNFFSI